MTLVGAMYMTGGHGLKEDSTKAVSWFKKGADAGSADAMAFLGQSYTRGKGVENCSILGVMFLTQGAMLGSALGCRGLATGFRYGEGGLPQDERQATTWYRKLLACKCKLSQTNRDDALAWLRDHPSG